MNTTPGSADSHADLQIKSHRYRALIVFFTSPFHTSCQSSSFFTASMNLSEIHTDRLACSIMPGVRLTVMNSSMSGWLSSSMTIKAPLRLPPCWITSPVATEYNCAHEHGPDAVPLTVLIYEPRGRNVERLMPTPPPRAMISVITFRLSRIPWRLSSGLGTTKQL